MEKEIRLPLELCDRIFTAEFELDTGDLSQTLLTNLVQLYGEAICFYANLSAEKNSQQYLDQPCYSRRTKYYQEKIKRLLVRGDVQQCLEGRKGPQWGRELKDKIALADCNAREQVRTLADRERVRMIEQEEKIASSLLRQRTDLMNRIERRSKSKQKKKFLMAEIDLNCPPKPKRSLLNCQFD